MTDRTRIDRNNRRLAVAFWVAIGYAAVIAAKELLA